MDDIVNVSTMQSKPKPELLRRQMNCIWKCRRSFERSGNMAICSFPWLVSHRIRGIWDIRSEYTTHSFRSYCLLFSSSSLCYKAIKTVIFSITKHKRRPIWRHECCWNCMIWTWCVSLRERYIPLLPQLHILIFIAFEMLETNDQRETEEKT